MKLKISKWDPATFKCGSVILICGKRGTGKSFLMKDLAYHIRDKVDYGVCMSPTDDVQDGFRSFMPASLIYNAYTEEKVSALMQQQKRDWKKGSGKEAFVMLDDCLFDKSVLTSTVMRELFMNGRHRHITLVLIVQYIMDMPSALRSQVDYVFTLRENIISNRDRLWKQFFGFFNTFASFCECLDATTENFSCMVYDGKSAKTNNLEDCVFWYRASEVPSFRLCRPVYWRLDERFFHDREEEFEEMREVEKTRALKKKMAKEGVLGVEVVE